MPHTTGTGNMGSTAEAMTSADLISEFTKCLGTMSHSRAGWDYQLPPAQRAKEDREESESLSRARAIWAQNPMLHDDLRAAFQTASPLARMQEIEGGA